MTYKKRRLKKEVVWGGILVVVIAVAGFFVWNNMNKGGKDVEPPKVVDPEVKPDPVVKEDSELNLLFFGDIMFHGSQLNGAKTADGYSFDDNFENIKETVSNAGVAFANYETSTNTKLEPNDYPMFNTPPEALSAIANAGFDVLSTVNNHTLDAGLDGVLETIDIIKENNMKHIGTHKEANKPEILYVEKNDIKVAYVAYSYGFNGLETEEKLQYVNSINETLIESQIKEAKQNADFVVVYYHWGEEYARDINKTQKELAQSTISWGADMIVASHPHVVQTMEMIDGKYVFYSLGNGISNQRRETLGSDLGAVANYTEDGLMISMDLQKNGETGEVTVKQVEKIPTWVYRFKNGDVWNYRILICDEVLTTNSIGLSSDLVERVRQSKENTLSILD